MIDIHDLWKRFGRHQAVKGVSLRVPQGSAYALIGANGAGKTTTIKILMNILAPTSGSAQVFGVNSRRLSVRELAHIGYVSENQEFPEKLSVAEYFNFLRPFYSGWDRELEQSLRTQLRLPAERMLGALSHGMRMKMALAAALPFHPRLLILDEPFSGLDPLVRDEFMEGVLGQAGEVTILISSHELAEIEAFATHVAFMDDGKMLFDEAMEDLSFRFRKIRLTLDHPAATPPEVPAEWIQFAPAGNTLEFVDTQFSPDVGERVQQYFHGVRNIDADPLPLRSIFTTLARHTRPAGTRPA